MAKFTVELSEEEVKALEWDMISIQEWLDNAIHNKARQCMYSIVDRAVQPGSDMLSKSDISHIRVMLDERAIPPVIPVKQLPEEIKAEIVKRAIIKSAAEREAERIAEETKEDKSAAERQREIDAELES